jgi:GT2 family glycosyltransferase
MDPVVDIIICVKNNKDIIAKCLDSVENQNYEKINCFVLDDNSQDGTPELIKKDYSFVRCILLEGKGPAHNRNMGIEESSGKYIVTLDSDSILKKDWISKMVKFMEENETVGIASGKILYENSEKINIAGGGMKKSGIAYHIGEEELSSKHNKPKKVFYLCSAAMIIRRKIFEIIGPFDPDYFYGYEDLDLCWRANLAGWDVVYYPFAESYHEQNSTIKKISSARISFLGNRNRILTLLKNYELSSLISNSPLFFAHFLFLVLFRKQRCAIIKAYMWNLKNFKNIRNKRKKIKSFRIVKDSKLSEIF